MKKLSKAQEREKSAHVDAIQEKHTALEEAITAYNAAMAEHKAAIEKAVEELNDTIKSAEEWRSNINSDQESYYGDRSEKWQEGDAGGNYSSWKDEWGNEFEEVEVELPEDLEVPNCDVTDTIENLPDEPG